MWMRAKFKGDSHQIPRVCPNCLQPADTEWRYCYTAPMPLYIFDRTRYWQTFYYCSGCSAQLDAFFKKEKVLGWLFFLWIIGGVFTLVGAIAQSEKDGALVPLAQSIGQDAIVIGSLVLYVALVVGLILFIKSRYKKRAPLQAHQAAWGPAAYYTGNGFFGFSSYAMYKAARPEWIKAMAQFNPDAVDDKDYERIVGAPKASKPEGGKPFAG